ncbi:MAG: stage II sporulation protein M [Burkholderiales bacterium]
MNQALFEKLHRDDWLEFEGWLTTLGKRGSTRAAMARADVARQWPHRYRELAHHLALARERAYSPELVDSLNQLALRGHQALYGARSNALNGVLRFIGQGFPAIVRQESRLVWIAMGFLFVPFLGLLAVLQYFPEFIHYLVGPDELRSFERMYQPGNRVLGPHREAANQVMMFGFYIWNNVKIDFQCFAGGLAFGVGSIFFLLFNGFSLGAIAGYLTHLGYIETFWGFVAGHSAWELLGAALSGAAGLKLGWALIAPGRLTRLAALKEAARPAVLLLYGAAGMTTFAASIEAFWSSSALIPPAIKYAVGVAFWLLFAVYFTFAGHGRQSDAY